MTASVPPGETNSALPAAAVSEWRTHWRLVVTSAIAYSIGTIAIMSMGMFFQPLEREFGWSRSDISSGLLIMAIIVVPLAPVVGAVVDRWGARRIAIPGTIVYGLAFSSLALVGSSPVNWWILWAVLAVASLGVTPTIWMTAVANSFEKSRGTALACVLSGSALGSFTVPQITRVLIDMVGWRATYVYLGLGWSTLVLILVVLFFFDPRDRQRLRPIAEREASGPAIVLPGLSFRQAVRSSAFQKIALASFFVSIWSTGSVIHLVPMLTARGLTREEAGAAAGAAGIAAIAGKMGIGWLCDRMDARLIAAVGLALTVIPLSMLAIKPEGTSISFLYAIAAVATLGFATGVELSITAYLTNRYTGPRSFGQNYGAIGSVIAVAAGIGPVVAGAIYDSTGGYMVWLLSGILPVMGVGLLMLTMRPYPVWDVPEPMPS